MITALLLMPSVPHAQAAQQTLGELRANRVKAAANLRATKSTLRVAMRDLRIAKEVHQDAYRSFQRT
ncbi:MAG: hypothetical protein ACLGH3_02830, partial [Actinomycetota bacterium]